MQIVKYQVFAPMEQSFGNSIPMTFVLKCAVYRIVKLVKTIQRLRVKYVVMDSLCGGKIPV